MKLIFFIFIPFLLFANLCWCNMWWRSSSRGGGTWCGCPNSYDTSHKCQWKCSKGSCSCVKEENEFCPSYMKHNSLGQCVPNPDLTPDECAKQGGSYVKASSFTSTFSSTMNAVASLYGSGCYSPTWASLKINKFKNKVSSIVNPKNALLGALMLSPVSKLFKAPALIGALRNDLKDKNVTPKLLQDNRITIDTKYNPATGRFEPKIKMLPRQKKLPPEKLFGPPKNESDANELLGVGEDLKKFSESRFGRNINNADELKNAKIDYDIDTSPATKTKIAEDLREIFRRSSKPQEKQFPVPVKKNPEPNPPIKVNPSSLTPKVFTLKIKDASAPGGEIVAKVERQVKQLTKTKYQVLYKVKPQGAKKPTIILYKVDTSNPHAPVTPKYKIGDNNYVESKPTPLYPQSKPSSNSSLPVPTTKNNSTSKSPPVPIPGDTKGKDSNPKTSSNSDSQSCKGTTIINNVTNNYYNEKNETLPDLRGFKPAVTGAITTAFAYKINLFTCPDAVPKCPNSLSIKFPVLKKDYNLTIPDPLCKVIKDIDNPKISPEIDTAGNLLVLLAGVLGALSLFRRD